MNRLRLIVFLGTFLSKYSLKPLVLAFVLISLSACTTVLKKSQVEEGIKDVEKQTVNVEKKLSNGIKKRSDVYHYLIARGADENSAVYQQYAIHLKEMERVKAEYSSLASGFTKYLNNYLDGWGDTKEISSKDPEYEKFEQLKSGIGQWKADFENLRDRGEEIGKRNDQLMKDNGIGRIKKDELKQTYYDIKDANKDFRNGPLKSLTLARSNAQYLVSSQQEYQNALMKYADQVTEVEKLLEKATSAVAALRKEMKDKKQIFYDSDTIDGKNVATLNETGEKIKLLVGPLKEMQKNIKKIYSNNI